jgi:hypothetical protein
VEPLASLKPLPVPLLPSSGETLIPGSVRPAGTSARRVSLDSAASRSAGNASIHRRIWRVVVDALDLPREARSGSTVPLSSEPTGSLAFLVHAKSPAVSEGSSWSTTLASPSPRLPHPSSPLSRPGLPWSPILCRWTSWTMSSSLSTLPCGRRRSCPPRVNTRSGTSEPRSTPSLSAEDSVRKVLETSSVYWAMMMTRLVVRHLTILRWV